MFRGERKIPKKGKRGFELAREVLAAISTLGQMHCPKKTAPYSINFLSANALSMSPRTARFQVGVFEDAVMRLLPLLLNTDGVGPFPEELPPRAFHRCSLRSLGVELV